MSDAKMAARIEEALKDFWAQQSLSVDSASTAIDDLVAAMDSMTAVEALIEVENVVGMSLPSGEVIRRGGYDNEDQFVTDVTARVLKYVEEHSK